MLEIYIYIYVYTCFFLLALFLNLFLQKAVCEWLEVWNHQPGEFVNNKPKSTGVNLQGFPTKLGSLAVCEEVRLIDVK